MPKKKLPQTIEECNAELELTQKQLQQYENRNKMLNRKLSVEKRKERNHRIFLYGGFMESIVPELKVMTEDEGKDFLYQVIQRGTGTACPCVLFLSICFQRNVRRLQHSRYRQRQTARPYSSHHAPDGRTGRVASKVQKGICAGRKRRENPPVQRQIQNPQG